MKEINLEECKYPNIVAEMQVRNISFPEMADIMELKTVRTVKKILVTGESEIWAGQLFNIARFMEIKLSTFSYEYLVAHTLRTTDIEDGVELKEKVILLKEKAQSILSALVENKVGITTDEKRANNFIIEIMPKAFHNQDISYAEYIRLLESIEIMEIVYKRWQGKQTTERINRLIETQPQEAAARLVEMFHLMDLRTKSDLFLIAERFIKNGYTNNPA